MRALPPGPGKSPQGERKRHDAESDTYKGSVRAGTSRHHLVSVLLTDDEGIRLINREYRDLDRPTDVLSFPMNDLTAGKFDPSMCERDPDTGEILLGDMVLSIPRCEEQGEEFGHGYDREVQYLTVHSVLHLLGYDHVDEGPMKKQMRAREKMIMGD